jgi:spore coat-associated protein N
VTHLKQKTHTLDLSINPNAVVNIDNLKPGDEVYREFTFENKGSLDIYQVLLDTKYTVEDAKSDNTDDFANHIKVTIMYNTSSATVPVVETTLAQLKEQTPDLTAIDEFVGSTQRPEESLLAKKKKCSCYSSLSITAKIKTNSKAINFKSIGHLMRNRH